MKKSTRWPIWKITAYTAACAVGCPLLFWLSRLVDQADKQSTSPGGGSPMLTISSFLMMIGIAIGMLGVLGVIWLFFRIREARTPVWKRKSKKKRF